MFVPILICSIWVLCTIVYTFLAIGLTRRAQDAEKLLEYYRQSSNQQHEAHAAIIEQLRRCAKELQFEREKGEPK